jgi:hypothetical protein
MCHKLAMEMAQTSSGFKTQSKIVHNVVTSQVICLIILVIMFSRWMKEFKFDG